MKYDFKEIEARWQKEWDDKEAFKVGIDYSKPKFFPLVEFPYPSAQGLHVGHPRSYTAIDIIARKRRQQGYNVLYPMGWDAFGLPTENFAMKNNIHPAIVTKNNVARFKAQLKSLGLSFDWSREINTTDPDYFKWTQWIFLKLFEKGLAYKKKMSVNWCTSCKVVLANEEVVNGLCERCHSEVIHKEKSQWMLKITEYAQRLLDDLDDLDFIDRVKLQQKNWIGRSTGAEVDFETTAGQKLTVYTTRPDTLFGATYMVIAPEHPFIVDNADKISNMAAVDAYKAEAAKKSDFERTEVAKDKTGVKLEGVEAINPVNGKHIPIFVSDYVLITYGTGAIMAVPAHDTRDWEFAKEFNLPIIEVVQGGDVQNEAFTDVETGIMVNSEFLNGLEVKEAKEKIITWLDEKGVGKPKVNFKLRDWVFSRQRYWGEPIPLVWCDKCGWVPINEEDLPLRLPDLESFQPSDNGESPLANVTDWVNCKCPKCGGDAQRETDTMPQWAGSSWYFLRYCDPHNDKELASKEALEYWMPVDWYNGGMEHTTLHLLY
ncbi:MAG: leucine--tRNA ligase, partial [Clostridia bacterium]|nr:leucine--tRNA ligase [Clostridia bacterium]